MPGVKRLALVGALLIVQRRLRAVGALRRRHLGGHAAVEAAADVRARLAHARRCRIARL